MRCRQDMYYKDRSKVAKGRKDIYKLYCSTAKDPVSYNLFIEILSKFNTKVMDHLLEGHEFEMGYMLSNLRIVRRNRDPRSPRVDWKGSFKLKQEILDRGGALYDAEKEIGEKWIVYYTGGRYFRFRWYKAQCRVKNKAAYRFDPTRGKKGNKEKLTELINNDDLAYLRFRYNTAGLTA